MTEKSDPEQQTIANDDRPDPHRIVSTTSILHNFPRNKSPHMYSAPAFEQSDTTEYNKILEQLRAYKPNERHLFGFGAPKPVDEDAAVSLFQYYFPCRGKLEVQVFDFGPARAERSDITLGDVEQGLSILVAMKREEI